MSHHTNEELRAELKSLADTLESVLNTAESKSKEEVDSLKKKHRPRWKIPVPVSRKGKSRLCSRQKRSQAKPIIMSAKIRGPESVSVPLSVWC